MKFIRFTLAATLLAGIAAPALAQQPAASPAAQAPAAQAAQTPPTATTTQDSAAATQATPPHATAGDLQVGAAVLGADGQALGTIETADATGATVTTGTVRGRLALDAFYKSEQGLVIGYNRADFERMGAPVAAGNSAAPAAADTPSN